MLQTMQHACLTHRRCNALTDRSSYSAEIQTNNMGRCLGSTKAKRAQALLQYASKRTKHQSSTKDMSENAAAASLSTEDLMDVHDATPIVQ